MSGLRAGWEDEPDDVENAAGDDDEVEELDFDQDDDEVQELDFDQDDDFPAEVFADPVDDDPQGDEEDGDAGADDFGDAGFDEDFEEDVDDDDLGDEELELDPGPELAGSVDVFCPYCGAGVEMIVDPVGGDLQEYVEDCEVCCQPWSVRVTVHRDGSASVQLETLDEG